MKKRRLCVLSNILTVVLLAGLPVEINNPVLASQVRFQNSVLLNAFASKVATSAVIAGHSSNDQARNQGGLENFSPPPEKCVGYSLKILDIVKKFGPLSENSSPLLVSQAGYGPGNYLEIFYWPYFQSVIIVIFGFSQFDYSFSIFYS